MSKQRNDDNNSVSTVLANSLEFIFDMIRQSMRFFELRKSAKITDSFNEKFDTVENVLLKIEKRLQESQRKLDKLTTLVITSHILLIVSIFTFLIITALIK